MSKGRKKRRQQIKRKQLDRKQNQNSVSVKSNPNAYTLHAFKRQVRLAEIEDIIDVEAVFNRAVELAKNSKYESEAFRIVVLPKQHNEKWGDQSNGDELWSMARLQNLITFMFRRSTQPKTCASLRVKKVTIL